jgi:hypothetical protein
MNRGLFMLSVCTIIGILTFVFSITGCGESKSGQRTKKQFRNVDNSIKITFVDSVDGRPTYNVEFNDGTALDQMYPEEIAQSLITGQWTYDETLSVVGLDSAP